MLRIKVIWTWSVISVVLFTSVTSQGLNRQPGSKTETATSGNKNAASGASRSRMVARGSRTYSYSSSSARNYNSGSRYYVRRTMTIGTRAMFGYTYSYYPTPGYFYSGYGYRIYVAPSRYKPIYVKYAYYFPPMFMYYYFSNPRYWQGSLPNYVCNNELAFWPLENQTDEFVDQLTPRLNFAAFDVELPESPDNDLQDLVPQIEIDLKHKAVLTEVNSFELNRKLFGVFEVNETQQRQRSSNVTTSIYEAEVNERFILAYSYFACPDGKDPEEVYCCGPSNAQYCCTYEEYGDAQTISWGFTIAMVIAFVFFFCLAVALVRKIQQRCASLSRNSRHGFRIAGSGTPVGQRKSSLRNSDAASTSA